MERARERGKESRVGFCFGKSVSVSSRRDSSSLFSLMARLVAWMCGSRCCTESCVCAHHGMYMKGCGVNRDALIVDRRLDV